jgi:hypothetical protein
MSKVRQQKERRILEAEKSFEVFMESEELYSNKDRILHLILQERKLAMEVLGIEFEEDFIMNKIIAKV